MKATKILSVYWCKAAELYKTIEFRKMRRDIELLTISIGLNRSRSVHWRAIAEVKQRWSVIRWAR
jgi:hypothetical protein